jgi:PEGA domain
MTAARLRPIPCSAVMVAAALLSARGASAQTPTSEPRGDAGSSTSTSPAPGSAATAPTLADTLVGDARDDYVSGRELYATGDYAGALLRFESAYRSSADPRLLWNAAVCQKAMGHYVRAVALVRRYVDSASHLVTPEAARIAEAFVIAAEALTAHLDVVPNVPDAAVFLDGEPAGPTPLSPAYRIDVGVHDLSVTKSGFSAFTTKVTVTDSTDVHVRAWLSELPRDGRVAVHGRRGDTIAVDGRVVAGETWEGELPSGPHEIRVTAPGWRPFRADVVVEPGQTRTLDVRLDPEPRVARAGGAPAWAWIVGGTVVAAGAATAGYFLFKPAEPSAIPVQGSIATVRTP